MDEGTYQRMVAIAFKVVEDENIALKARIAELEAQTLNKLDHTWKFVHITAYGKKVVQCTKCKAYEHDEDTRKVIYKCKNGEK